MGPFSIEVTCHSFEARYDVGRNTGMDDTHRRDSAENFGVKIRLPVGSRQSVRIVKNRWVLSCGLRLPSCDIRGKVRYGKN